MKTENIWGSVGFFGFFVLCYIIYLIYRWHWKKMNERHYGNPSDHKFVIKSGKNWIPPQCSCLNCIGEGHWDYYWTIEAWWTSGTGEHRKRRPAWANRRGERFKTWHRAMQEVRYNMTYQQGSFWRGMDGYYYKEDL